MYGLKVIANVKGDNRQTDKHTGQKQYTSNHSIWDKQTCKSLIFSMSTAGLSYSGLLEQNFSPDLLFCADRKTTTHTYRQTDRLTLSLSSFGLFLSKLAGAKLLPKPSLLCSFFFLIP